MRGRSGQCLLRPGVLGLATLFGIAGSSQVWAQEPKGFHPVDSVLEMLNVKTPTPPPAPDFVEQSRPKSASGDYLSIGKTYPQRSLKVKSPKEIEAAEAELDAARAAQLAGRRPKPEAAPTKVKPKSNPIDIRPGKATQN